MDMLQLTLRLDGGPGADKEAREGLGRSLRRDLLETDVETVEPAEKEAPAGSKAALALDWNTLLITLVSSGTLTAVIAGVQAWLLRNRECSVTVGEGEDMLTISGAGPYSDEQKAIIERWLKRNKGYVLPGE
jgi:hypothetical protein